MQLLSPNLLLKCLGRAPVSRTGNVIPTASFLATPFRFARSTPMAMVDMVIEAIAMVVMAMDMAMVDKDSSRCQSPERT